MALGDSYNNNAGSEQNKQWHPTVYSPYRFNNAESTIDPTCLTFSYWKSSLRISISPRKATGNDDIAFDMDNNISIYLNHTKARILAEEIKRFLSDPGAYNHTGVPSGQGFITISDGSEYGSQSPCITIAKLDPNSGSVLSSFAYQFKTDYYYAIRGFDSTNPSNFTKATDDYKNIEIEMMVTLLESYYNAMTCAVAFTVQDQGKYGETRLNNRLDSIMGKLGIDTRNPNGKRNYSSNSNFFNNSQGASSSSGGSYDRATLDDIE